METVELKTLWSKILEVYKTKFGDNTCCQLLKNALPYSLENNILTIVLKNNFMKNMLMIEKPVIDSLISEVAGFPLGIDVVILEGNDAPDMAVPAPNNSSSDTHEEHFVTNLDPKYRFDNFVIGNNCRLTCAAAKKVSEEPGTIYNPLFVYGKPGLGKTHLIQAIGNKMLEIDPKAKILYTTTNNFLNEMVQAIRNSTINSLHERYCKLDCLIIDDIQQLKGKEKTQEEFFNTFNTLYSSHKQIIIASDRLPQEIETLQDRITSRLANGFLGDIQEPDYETRLAILQKKLEERNMELSNECANIIASSITSDIRLIESVCNNLHLCYEMNDKITPDLVMQIIEKHGNTVKQEGISFENLLNEVAGYYGVSRDDLVGKKRNAKINDARQVLMYLGRTLTGLTFDEIGKELGNRDHTTIMHGYEKIYNSINQNNKSLIIGINFIKSKLDK